MMLVGCSDRHYLYYKEQFSKVPKERPLALLMKVGCFCLPLATDVGLDSSVSVETRYELDGPGLNRGAGNIFRTRPDRPWDPPSLLYNMYRVSFPGVRRSGRGVNHPPPSGAEVRETVELYLYLPSGPSWFVLGRTFFLGAVEELRKATISFVMSLRLSVHMEQLGSHWTDFDETLYLNCFQKRVEKTQVSSKSDKINGYFT